ncbi:uncharacterized protein [Triticum aestivum]|uniref:uncharacterized protein n=1 Tax=Triticum aestivum TaxID=4565 RepID=UPI000DF5518E|nr:uncharacterized protein LOC123188894 [Triticum aestivum]
MHAGNCLRLCGKGGVENSRSCHCDCLALIKLLRSKNNGWYIAERRERSTTTEVDLWHRRFTFRFPFLEELDESATLMEQAAFAVVRLAMSADKKVREEDRVKGVRREALPPESEMFNGKMNLHASGWVKRCVSLNLSNKYALLNFCC